MTTMTVAEDPIALDHVRAHDHRKAAETARHLHDYYMSDSHDLNADEAVARAAFQLARALEHDRLEGEHLLRLNDHLLDSGHRVGRTVLVLRHHYRIRPPGSPAVHLGVSVPDDEPAAPRAGEEGP